VVENRVPREVFVPEREEVTCGGENCILRSSKIFALRRILNRGSVVIIGMGYKLQVFRFLAGHRDFSVFVTHSGLWHSPTLVFSGVSCALSRGRSDLGIRVICHLHPTPRLRIRGYDEPKRAVYLGNAFNCIIKYFYYLMYPAKH
jgi:hypothetical protein